MPWMFLLLFIIFHFLLHSFSPPFAQSFLDACVPDIPGQNILWSPHKYLPQNNYGSKSLLAEIVSLLVNWITLAGNLTW